MSIHVETISPGRDFIRTVTPFLTPGECAELIRDSEAEGYAPAPITTPSGFVMRDDIRNNTRVMRDDHGLADRLWQRLREFVPEKRAGWRAIGLNERFRFYRYEPGEYFRWHFDGAFHRSSDERSMLTAMIYLNDDFAGGTTDFDHIERSCQIRVRPASGKALLFAHGQRHQGAPPTVNRKYVLRTDVMYRRAV